MTHTDDALTRDFNVVFEGQIIATIQERRPGQWAAFSHRGRVHISRLGPFDTPEEAKSANSLAGSLEAQ